MREMAVVLREFRDAAARLDQALRDVGDAVEEVAAVIREGGEQS